MGGIIASLIVGGIAGWLAGLIMKGQGLGILMNIVVGRARRRFDRLHHHRDHRRGHPALACEQAQILASLRGQVCTWQKPAPFFSK